MMENCIEYDFFEKLATNRSEGNRPMIVQNLLLFFFIIHIKADLTWLW